GEPAGWVAFAVDGKVAGIGRSYPQGDYATVWSMLHERALGPGDHEITAYAVSGTAEAPELHAVPIVASDA
ncbi:MAG TPA: hypothetical protein VD926_03870, partial [Acidimicrobiales bacterium]|nr:hypothetical protein [Acidimicrobiales bacterium]